MSEVGEPAYKKILIVDEGDNVIGAIERLEKVKKGAIKRASRIFVFDESGRILIQRRSNKVLSPLLLDQSAAGHVDEGETYKEAAVRELYEELGLKNEIEEVVVSYRTKGFFNGIYRLKINNNTQINFNKHEVAEVFWIDIAELEKMMGTSPELFTHSFIELWSQLRDKIIPT